MMLLSMKFLSSEVLLYLYESAVRPCTEYCCYAWAGSPKPYVRALVLHLLIHFDLIVVMWLVKVCCLCTVSKSTLLNFLVPLLFCHSCSTRFANTHHNFAVSIPWYSKEVYANSFFYGILYLQIYNLNNFKGNVNRHLTSLRTGLTFHLLVFLSLCNSMPSSHWLVLCGIKTIRKIFASIVTFFWAICSIVK